MHWTTATRCTAFGALLRDYAEDRFHQLCCVQGQVTVKGHFGPGARDLVVAPYQAACLMLFNDTPELTVGDMMERLNLPEDDVVRVVSSLAHAKHHILKRKKDDGDDGAKDEKKEKKDKKEKRPDKSTTYYVHWGWSDKMRRCAVWRVIQVRGFAAHACSAPSWFSCTCVLHVLPRMQVE